MSITVVVVNGQGLPQEITVIVPENATREEIEAAIEKAARDV